MAQPTITLRKYSKEKVSGHSSGVAAFINDSTRHVVWFQRYWDGKVYILKINWPVILGELIIFTIATIIVLGEALYIYHLVLWIKVLLKC